MPVNAKDREGMEVESRNTEDEEDLEVDGGNIEDQDGMEEVEDQDIFHHHMGYSYYPYPAPYQAPYYPSACPAGTSAYTVQPGDSLYTISSRYGIAPESIVAANPSVNFNYLQAGQIICL